MPWTAGTGKACARACGTAVLNASNSSATHSPNARSAAASLPLCSCAATSRCAMRSSLPSTPSQNSSAASGADAPHRRFRASTTPGSTAWSDSSSPARTNSTSRRST